MLDAWIAGKVKPSHTHTLVAPFHIMLYAWNAGELQHANTFGTYWFFNIFAPGGRCSISDRWSSVRENSNAGKVQHSFTSDTF